MSGPQNTTNVQPPLDFELPPDNRPRWFKYVLVLLVIAGVAAFVLWNLHTRQNAAIAAIPERPVAALTAFPEIFRTRISDAERRARTEYGGEAIDALAELARLYHANGLFTQASQIYPALIQLDPHNPRWPFLQSTILAGFGRLDEALPLLKSALALAPERVPLRLQLAGLLLKTNHSTEAAALYRAIITEDPGNIHAIIGLARIDITAQMWTSANSRLILATHLQPDFAEPWNLLATVHEKLNQPELAQTDRARAKKSRELPAPPDDWIDTLADYCYDAYQVRVAADIARSTGDTVRAVALLNRALDFAPDDAATHRQLGKLFSDLNDPVQARQHLERATVLAPSDADAWAWLIALGNKTGDTTAALNDSSLALAHCPQSGGIRYEYARALKAVGNLDAALYQFQETRRLRPEESAGVSIEIALIHFRQNRVTEGAAELRAALEADPGQPVALTTMTRLAIGQNNAAEAAQWLARATAEPRVPRNDIEQLNILYRRQFR